MPPKSESEIMETIDKISGEAEKIDAIAEIRGHLRPESDSKFYPIIQKYNNGNLNLEEAIQTLLEPIEKANDGEDINALDLWYSFIHSAKRTPFRNAESHDRLGKLLKGIKVHSNNEAPKDDYAGLRDFGLAARETMNDSPGVGAGYTEPEAHAYANMQYFYATISRDGTFDLWLYAIWEMRAALENHQADDGPDDAHKPGTALQKYRARVPAAAAWIFGAGHKLYQKEEDLTPKRPNEGNPARGGELWKGMAGFSKERWALWKSRFEEIGQMDNVDEYTRNIAKEAVSAMAESEKS
ncbi:hypothetical protein BU24DRAFT_149609 [Aaosphaeria arxii CBS 175.79]|uniref:Uncharacterized protein n=1 Tax=Aaosphaeria arxii CBS 175.79 TaxID=1450172 RepID=A0A6A5XXK4_9PLEO|nr:uncharacterized protein BU24DRAFT_149609 [Aaosphaeria arxii CBS 175.79]KAF2017380.1 hypothetical protein BU24DRAFT_149609 [Aaosphaeria arxii CBS 175.79]